MTFFLDIQFYNCDYMILSENRRSTLSKLLPPQKKKKKRTYKLVLHFITLILKLLIFYVTLNIRERFFMTLFNHSKLHTIIYKTSIEEYTFPLFFLFSRREIFFLDSDIQIFSEVSTDYKISKK